MSAFDFLRKILAPSHGSRDTTQCFALDMAYSDLRLGNRLCKCRHRHIRISCDRMVNDDTYKVSVTLTVYNTSSYPDLIYLIK